MEQLLFEAIWAIVLDDSPYIPHALQGWVGRAASNQQASAGGGPAAVVTDLQDFAAAL